MVDTATPASIMAQLVDAILKGLKDNGIEVQDIGAKDLIDGTINLANPAVNITINSAESSQVTMFTWKWVFILSMIIVFPYRKAGPKGEFVRKEKVYQLIEAISAFVQGQKFGLPLSNYLELKRFKNITTAAYAKAGYQIYNVDFQSAFNVEAVQADLADEGTLSKIVADYWICPPDSTSFTPPPRAEDIIVTL